MRFNELTYLHTEEFEDIVEIKFTGNFDTGGHDLTVEIWVQDNNIDVVIMDNYINEIIHVTDEEEDFTLNFAMENNYYKKRGGQ